MDTQPKQTPADGAEQEQARQAAHRAAEQARLAQVASAAANKTSAIRSALALLRPIIRPDEPAEE